MLPRPGTGVAALGATLAAAIASIYIAHPWDMLSAVVATIGGATVVLFIALRLSRGHA